MHLHLDIGGQIALLSGPTVHSLYRAGGGVEIYNMCTSVKGPWLKDGWCLWSHNSWKTNLIAIVRHNLKLVTHISVIATLPRDRAPNVAANLFLGSLMEETYWPSGVTYECLLIKHFRGTWTLLNATNLEVKNENVNLNHYCMISTMIIIITIHYSPIIQFILSQLFSNITNKHSRSGSEIRISNLYTKYMQTMTHAIWSVQLSIYQSMGGCLTKITNPPFCCLMIRCV